MLFSPLLLILTVLLQVYWHNKEHRVICGKAGSIKVYVRSEQVRITFTTDQTIHGMGFSASLSEIDGGTQAGKTLHVYVLINCSLLD